jgi:hypothetical protein
MGDNNKMQTRHVFSQIAALGFALFVGMAQGASLNILSVDDLSCAAWRKSKENPEQRSSYLVWLRGVLTGHNYALPNQQVSSISGGTIENYVNDYCSKNQNGEISEAVFRLSDQFSGRNQAVRK